MHSSLIDRVEALEGCQLNGAELERLLAQQGITPDMVRRMIAETVEVLEAREADGHGADPYDAAALQSTGCHCDTEALTMLRTALAELEGDHAPI